MDPVEPARSPSLPRIDDIPVPMDCSPAQSVSPHFSPSVYSGSTNGKNRGKKPLCLKLSRKGDRVWNWVKEICPGKRAAMVQEPVTSPLEDEDSSSLLSCLKPFKKRRGGSEGGTCGSFSESEGMVVPRFEPPAHP